MEEDIVCEPIFNTAGAIFEETLLDLKEKDRQLLLFSAGTNLVAVRWLFVLGANRYAFDSNGTTPLHTACRTGSLPIILELLHQGIPLDVTDASGWTPLHIAINMGRREVVLSLLQANAPLLMANNKGQTPLDMCYDTWTREVIQSFMVHAQAFPEETWQFKKGMEIAETEKTGELQYEPFFVPRSPAITEVLHREDFITLGMQIFNKRPGEGLAFLVASGCTDGCPIDISTFLRCEELDLGQIGNFLGENFSLAQMLRLEFINSVKLLGTSIVSSLAKVFTLLQIPPDLQKIDRLVHGVAQVWWRQHDNIMEEQDVLPGTAQLPQCVGEKNEECVDEDLLSSFTLKQYIASPETLYQIMYSMVMLHRILYSLSEDDDSDAETHISLADWLEVNRGLEAGSNDVLLEILEGVYRTVRNGIIPQFVIRKASYEFDCSLSTRLTLSGLLDFDVPHEGLTKSIATIEGWVWISGRGLANSAVTGTTESSNISSIFSETSARRRSAVGEKLPAQPGMVVSSHWDNRHGMDRTWLSLCYTLLLFSSSPGFSEVPFAFVHLRRVLVEHKKGEMNTLTLVGNPDCCDSEKECTSSGMSDARCCGKSMATKETERRCNVVVVFLLPDGRWQEFELPRLQIQVADHEELEQWVHRLRDVCRPLMI